MKFLLWGIIALAIVLWFLRDKKSRVKSAAAPPPPPPPPPPASDATELIVQCVSCGVHIPTSEAVTGPAGLVFCCEEHRIRHK